MRHEVNWLTITPMPYFDDLFVAMATDERFSTRAYFVKKTQKGYPLSATGVIYKQYFLEGVIKKMRLVGEAISSAQRRWIVGGWNEPVYALILCILAIRGKKYWIFTDAPIPEGRSSNPLRRYIRAHFLPFWMRHAQGVLGTGKMGVEALLQLGSPADKTFSLPYPLDESRFAAVETNAKDAIQICCSGRLVIKDKRFDLALKAFANCVAAFQSVEIRLVMAGAGDDKDVLEKLASDLGIASRVTFAGWQDQSGLKAIYDNSHIYLHPTDFEPYGVTVVEALYSGLYVIASDRVGSAVELIQKGKNGDLFPVGDLVQLTELLGAAIQRFVGSAPSKSSVRDASLKWGMKQYLQHFQSILES